jgi:hypothetical protein
MVRANPAPNAIDVVAIHVSVVIVRARLRTLALDIATIDAIRILLAVRPALRLVETGDPRVSNHRRWPLPLRWPQQLSPSISKNVQGNTIVE